MEYMTEDELRTVLAAKGYSQEKIDEMNATAQPLPGIPEYIEQLAAALRAWGDHMADAFSDFLEQITTIAYNTPAEKLPRPPRYAGPRNKGTQYTQRPPRVARSCCRKMRR